MRRCRFYFTVQVVALVILSGFFFSGCLHSFKLNKFSRICITGVNPEKVSELKSKEVFDYYYYSQIVTSNFDPHIYADKGGNLYLFYSEGSKAQYRTYLIFDLKNKTAKAYDLKKNESAFKKKLTSLECIAFTEKPYTRYCPERALIFTRHFHRYSGESHGDVEFELLVAKSNADLFYALNHESLEKIKQKLPKAVFDDYYAKSISENKAKSEYHPNLSPDYSVVKKFEAEYIQFKYNLKSGEFKITGIVPENEIQKVLQLVYKLNKKTSQKGYITDFVKYIPTEDISERVAPWDDNPKEKELYQGSIYFDTKSEVAQEIMYGDGPIVFLLGALINPKARIDNSTAVVVNKAVENKVHRSINRKLSSVFYRVFQAETLPEKIRLIEDYKDLATTKIADDLALYYLEKGITRDDALKILRRQSRYASSLVKVYYKNHIRTMREIDFFEQLMGLCPTCSKTDYRVRYPNISDFGNNSEGAQGLKHFFESPEYRFYFSFFNKKPDSKLLRGYMTDEDTVEVLQKSIRQYHDYAPLIVEAYFDRNINSFDQVASFEKFLSSCTNCNVNDYPSRYAALDGYGTNLKALQNSEDFFQSPEYKFVLSRIHFPAGKSMATSAVVAGTKESSLRIMVNAMQDAAPAFMSGFMNTNMRSVNQIGTFESILVNCRKCRADDFLADYARLPDFGKTISSPDLLRSFFDSPEYIYVFSRTGVKLQHERINTNEGRLKISTLNKIDHTLKIPYTIACKTDFYEPDERNYPAGFRRSYKKYEIIKIYEKYLISHNSCEPDSKTKQLFSQLDQALKNRNIDVSGKGNEYGALKYLYRPDKPDKRKETSNPVEIQFKNKIYFNDTNITSYYFDLHIEGDCKHISLNLQDMTDDYRIENYDVISFMNSSPIGISYGTLFRYSDDNFYQFRDRNSSEKGGKFDTIEEALEYIIMLTEVGKDLSSTY